MSGVTAAGVLNVLSKTRLSQLARDLDVALPPDAQKSAQIAGILAAETGLGALLPRLTRDELRAACRAHALDPQVKASRLGAQGEAAHVEV